MHPTPGRNMGSSPSLHTSPRTITGPCFIVTLHADFNLHSTAVPWFSSALFHPLCCACWVLYMWLQWRWSMHCISSFAFSCFGEARAWDKGTCGEPNKASMQPQRAGRYVTHTQKFPAIAHHDAAVWRKISFPSLCLLSAQRQRICIEPLFSSALMLHDQCFFFPSGPQFAFDQLHGITPSPREFHSISLTWMALWVPAGASACSFQWAFLLCASPTWVDGLDSNLLTQVKVSCFYSYSLWP